MVKVKEDLTGKKFGFLVVLRQSENDYISPKNKKEAKWWCQCECGSMPIEVRNSGLKSGHIKSCGCYQKEIAAKLCRLNKTENKYEKKDGYYIGYTDKNEPFYIDECDFELIRKYKWHIRSDGYLESFDGEHTRVLMHRLVMQTSLNENCFVDHILGNTTRNDNRKYNLRIVTKSQNNMNRGVGQNNTSGFVGVSWNHLQQKWHAYINANKKRFDLGFYDCLEQAVEVRKFAEKILHGDFAHDRSQVIGNERLRLFNELYGNSNQDSEMENAS